MIFAKLVRGNTVQIYMGIKEKNLKFSPDYSNIECAAGSIKPLNTEKTVFLIKPNVSVNPKKCKIMVVPNAKLTTLGSVSFQSVIEPGDGKFLGLIVRLDSKENIKEVKNLDWVMRLYCIL